MGPRYRAVLIVALAAMVVFALLWSLQRRLIYFPAREPPPEAAGARVVSFATGDGLRLDAWLVAGGGRTAVLVAPGNAGNRAGRLPLARSLAAEGLTVLLLDYRGYGGNPGDPSESGLAADARAAWAYLTGPGGFTADRVVLFGESLGAAVVTRLAAELSGPPPRGLVLRSPFASLASVGREHYPFLPVGLLLRDRYPLAEQIRGVHIPTVVVYGTADTVVPPAQSRRVADAAPTLVELMAVDGADHNDAVLGAGTVVVEAVTRVA